MTRILIGSALALISLIASDAVRAGLTATVDRTIITDLDTLQLTVRASDGRVTQRLTFPPWSRISRS